MMHVAQSTDGADLHWIYVSADYECKRKTIPDPVTAPENIFRCPNCSCNMHRKETRAWIFDASCITKTTISCEVCKCGFQSVDGAEHCFLRKGYFKSAVLGEFELCFAWSFLYKCRDDLEEGCLFFQMLRGLIKSLRRAGWSIDHLAAMQSLYKPLQEAVFDFVDLMRIDYVQVMSCSCPESGQHLVADGVRVSCKSDQQCLFGNWLPIPPDDPEAQELAALGSHRESRFVVRDYCSRETLRKLTHRDGAGQLEVNALQEWCTAYNKPLSVLMQLTTAGGILRCSNSRFFVIQWAQGFIHELGAHSPAVAIANLGCVPLIMKCVSAVKFKLGMPVQGPSPQWDAKDNADAATWLRPLFPFLHKLLNLSGRNEWALLCANACRILEDIAEVCWLQRLVLKQEIAISFRQISPFGSLS